MIDRCLVAAYDAGLEPLLVLTKSDLTSADKILEIYSTFGLKYVVTNREELAAGDAADRVREHLNGRITAFVGHSGVGKTTLVNSLVAEGRQRATGVVNAVTGRGRHTTTSALALPLPGGDGWVIDTPGVRSFGLHHIEPSRVILAFPDLEPGTEGCPRPAATTSRTARWTSGWPTATPTRPGSTRCAGCSPPANGARATDRRPGARVRPGFAGVPCLVNA